MKVPLANTHPDIAATLDAEASGFGPYDVVAGSHRIGVWRCPAHPGIPFRETINHRSDGRGCGICAGRQVVAGYNDLASTHPGIAATLDAEASGFSPEEVVAGSHRVGVWRCPAHPGIPFRETINHRSDGRGCGICAGRQVVAGYNDLATTHPDIAETLDAEASGFGPGDVVAGSNKVGVWRCRKHPGIPFRATVQHRTSGQGCGICNGRPRAEG